MSEDSTPSKLKWILIAVNGILLLGAIFFVLFVIRPSDHFVAKKLEARGYEVSYDWCGNTIWQHPTSVVGKDMNMTPEDCRLICQLPRLEALHFRRGGMSGLNLDDIGHCQELSFISFADITSFPGYEIRKLAVCPIEYLILDSVGLTDTDLEALMIFSQLYYLNLRGNTGITDAGLEHLVKMPSLDRLELTKTSVTKEGVEEFQKKRPDVMVFYGDSRFVFRNGLGVIP